MFDLFAGCGVVLIGVLLAGSVLMLGSAPGWLVPLMGMASSSSSRGSRNSRRPNYASAKSGPGSGTVGLRPRKLSPSHLKRPGRLEFWLEEVREALRRRVRAEAIQANPDLEAKDVPIDEAQIEAEALAFVKDQFRRLVDRHGIDVDVDAIFDEEAEPDEVREGLVAIANGCAVPHEGGERPDDTNDAIEAHAIRSTAIHRRLMRHLTRRQPGGSDYVLAGAVLEAMWFIRGDFELRRRWQELTTMNLLLGWAYGMPCALEPRHGPRAKSARSESAVTEAIFGKRHWTRKPGRLERTLRRFQRGLLDRHEPEMLLEVNAAAIAELIERDPDGMKDFGKAVAMDSIRLRASAEQRQSVSPDDEKLINRLLGCSLGSHGDKVWRGWMMLTLLDLSTGLPMVWLLLKASDKEAAYVEDLLTMAYRYFPDIEIEFLTADKAMDTEGTYRLSERKFGVHLIADLSANVAEDETKHLHHATDGCPTCRQCGRLMRYAQATFHGARDRKKLALIRKRLDADAGKTQPGLWFEVAAEELVVHGLGRPLRLELTLGHNSANKEAAWVTLAPGVDVTPLITLGLVLREHIRWSCDCSKKSKLRTYLDDDWRLHTWAPRRDVHQHGRPDRFDLRQQLARMHKSKIEGYHGLLRLRGMGTDGADAPRTPNTDKAVAWLHFGRAYRITMRRLVQANGAYAESLALAKDLDLLRAPTLRDLLLHATAQHDERPEEWDPEIPHAP